jgi:hypothetical protein
MAISFSSLKEDALPCNESYAAMRRPGNGRDPQNVRIELDELYNGLGTC